MFKDNLVQMRKILQLTQEDIAEKLGVTRQSVAKWEAGDSVPDLDKCKQLADIFGVSLDDLANYEPDDNLGLGVPPRESIFLVWSPWGIRVRSSSLQRQESCLR